jgi:peptidoglycan/xylan/chitin deacetylase (PgdA/CDA1 family)
LAYFGIPAAFFISIGHVQDGSLFAHDCDAGFKEGWPMLLEDVRRLATAGFVFGSHGIYHEDFGKLDAPAADQVLQESRRMIAELSGRVPVHFSFPTGQRQINITRESFGLAQKHYPCIYSAYGGYNFPSQDGTHFLRIGNECNTLELSMVMNGYTGFRDVLSGNAWGLKTARLSPY